MQNILHSFLDKIDRSQTRLSTKISKKTAPELFNYDNDTVYLWSLIQDLEKTYHIISIRKKRKGNSSDEYEDAWLDFNREYEQIVRHWLDRSAKNYYSVEWEKAVDENKSDFKTGDFSALRTASLYSKSRSAKLIVNGFVKASQILSESDTALTLKQLSARCFSGNSKFLDGKEELIFRIFPQHTHRIIPRKVLIETSIPALFNKILFIENLDTFLDLVGKRHTVAVLSDITFIYCAGFKGSSARLRDPGNVIFSHISALPDMTLSEFSNFWFKASNEQVPVYFWGDLDYSGMGILAALRKSFPSCQAWEPAYNLMLKLAADGVSHTLEDTGKDEQKDPGSTGCTYADETLLPFMRNKQLFLDQEAVDFDSIV